METAHPGVLPAQMDPLETSLVEWKPVRRPRRGVSTYPLGNFLSGMETSTLHCPQLDDQGLGNFLSGMETSVLTFARPGEVRLGNFLSGMETQV